jgi:hypothetical protein
MSRNSDHRGATKEEFERFQRERAAIIQRWASRLGSWEGCAERACRRAKACTGQRAEACLRRAMLGLLDEDERATFQQALGLRAGGADGKEAWREAQRKVAQHKAGIAAMPLPGEG